MIKEQFKSGKVSNAHNLIRLLSLKRTRDVLAVLSTTSLTTVTDIMIGARKYEQCVVSQILAALLKYDLVTSVRRGKNILYKINAHKMDRVVRGLKGTRKMAI